MMSYEKMGRKVLQLEFIENEIRTNASVKAVLAILNGNFKVVLSRLNSDLLGGIDLEGIPGDQVLPMEPSIKKHLYELGSQFNLSDEETSIIIDSVIESLKNNEIFDSFLEKIQVD